MKIAIVILNWNGKKLLQKFLPSVIAHSSEADIYVADNASTDDSILFIKNTYPSISIIENSINGGYAKGYNDALAKIDADIYCLLNSDIEVTPEWITPIKKVFMEQANVAAVQPKILDYKKKTHFEYAGAAGGFIDQLGYPYCRGRIFNTLEKDLGQYNDTIAIQWASGACLFIRREVFEEVGKLDEDFFAHQEEIDLCWRIQNFGYKILYVGSSIVYHVGGATLNSIHPKKTFLNFRNTLFLLVKNVSGIRFIGLIFIRLFLDGLAAIKFLVEGRFSHILAILKAHFSFYRHFAQMLNKRKRIPKNKQTNTLKSIVFQYFVLKNKKYSDL